MSWGRKTKFPIIEAFNSNLFLLTLSIAKGQVALAKPILAPPVISIVSILIFLVLVDVITNKYIPFEINVKKDNSLL
jgi:hypothetical protein